MTKCLLGVLVGVFAGAFALELLDRKKPTLMNRVRERARFVADDFKVAFLDGYQHSEAVRSRTDG